jgi:hypothetical protein
MNVQPINDKIGLRGQVKRKRELEGFLTSSCCQDPATRREKQNEWGERTKLANTSSDILMAQEMNALSSDEREKVFEDIHGIPRVVEETPASVKRALQDLDGELTRILKKPAYDKALFLSPKYVIDRKLRLMFLRAQGFQANHAATHMVEHFEQKLELFGPDKLGKTITLEDLSEDDVSALSMGSAYFLSSSDRAGRRVLFNVCKLHKYKDRMNQLRVIWYLVMFTLMDDEDAQKNGIVAVIYNVGQFRREAVALDLTKDWPRIMRTLPLRLVGFHYCFDDAALHPAASLAKLVVGTNTRLRFRVHFGTC